MKNSAAGKLSPFVVKRKENMAALLAGSVLLHSLCHLSAVTVAGLTLSWDGSLCSNHSPVAVRHVWVEVGIVFIHRLSKHFKTICENPCAMFNTQNISCLGFCMFILKCAKGREMVPLGPGL